MKPTYSDSNDAEQSIRDWQLHIRAQLVPLETNIRNIAYTEQALELALQEIPANLPPTIKKFYHLHAELIIYDRVMQPLHKTTGSSTLSLGYHTRLAAGEMQNRLLRLLSEPLPALQNEHELGLFNITLLDIRDGMINELRDTYTMLLCYYQLWRCWLMPQPQAASMLQQETHLLQSALPSADSSPLTRSGERVAYVSVLLAQSYIYFLQHQDEQAMNCIQQAAERHDFYPERMPEMLTELEKDQEWIRLADWLVWLAPVLRRQYSDLHHYSDYWEKVLIQLPDREPQMWQALEDMLPLGGRIYEEKLLQYEKWQQWMDYQLSSGKDPASYKVTELKPLEKNAPEMLLPFYHQAVERRMAQKNRDGYKAAVKLLKRLSKLYAKLKREEQWEHYIEQFAGKHSRLRALQEELRKGKLIP